MLYFLRNWLFFEKWAQYFMLPEVMNDMEIIHCSKLNPDIVYKRKLFVKGRFTFIRLILFLCFWHFHHHWHYIVVQVVLYVKISYSFSLKKLPVNITIIWNMHMYGVCVCPLYMTVVLWLFKLLEMVSTCENFRIPI